MRRGRAGHAQAAIATHAAGTGARITVASMHGEKEKKKEGAMSPATSRSRARRVAPWPGASPHAASRSAGEQSHAYRPRKSSWHTNRGADAASSRPHSTRAAAVPNEAPEAPEIGVRPPECEEHRFHVHAERDPAPARAVDPEPADEEPDEYRGVDAIAERRGVAGTRAGRRVPAGAGGVAVTVRLGPHIEA
jgi:hypothetical protein